MNAHRLHCAWLLPILLTTGVATAHAQAGARLVGVTEICMMTPGLTPFPSFLAVDDAGRLYVHSLSPLAPAEMRSAWLLYDQLPPGVPTSISVRDGLAPHATHRFLVSMESGDVYEADGGACITLGNRIGFQPLANVFAATPVQVESRSWGQVRGVYRK